MAGTKLEEEKQLFHGYLHRNGLKKTHQKDLILETFLSNEGHLSVEDIYALVKKRDKKVGIVTVFRTLKSLNACGIAKEISLDDGLTRFEHCYYHPLHHHIICMQCHKVIEFLSPELERVQQEIVTRYSFQLLQQRIQIYGVCRDCREQRPLPDVPRLDTGKIFARDALNMALVMHQQGLNFYRSLAARIQDPPGREIFESLIREEEAHARELEQELDLLHQKESGLADAPVFLHYNPHDLQNLIPAMKNDASASEFDLDPHGALETAMQLEKRAAGFFQAYAEKFAETEGKQVLLRFAEQAMKHHATIRRRAEMTKPASA